MIASGIVLSTITSLVAQQDYDYDPKKLISSDDQLNWNMQF